MRLWPQHWRPPAYVDDAHVGLPMARSSPPDADGSPFQGPAQRGVALNWWQFLPPASQSAPPALVPAASP